MFVKAQCFSHLGSCSLVRHIGSCSHDDSWLNITLPRVCLCRLSFCIKHRSNPSDNTLQQGVN